MANLSSLLERHMLTAQSKGLSGSQLVDDRLAGSTHVTEGSVTASLNTSVINTVEPPDQTLVEPPTKSSQPQPTPPPSDNSTQVATPITVPFQPDDPQPEEIQWRRVSRAKRSRSKSTHLSQSFQSNQPIKIQENLYPQQDLVLLPAVNWSSQDHRGSHGSHYRGCYDCLNCRHCSSCFGQRCYSTTVYLDQGFTDTIEALNDCLDDTVEGPPLCHYLGLVVVRFLKGWWQRLSLRLEDRAVV